MALSNDISIFLRAIRPLILKKSFVRFFRFRFDDRLAPDELQQLVLYTSFPCLFQLDVRSVFSDANHDHLFLVVSVEIERVPHKDIVGIGRIVVVHELREV